MRRRALLEEQFEASKKLVDYIRELQKVKLVPNLDGYLFDLLNRWQKTSEAIEGDITDDGNRR